MLFYSLSAISIKNCHCLFSQNLLKIVQKCGGQYSDWSGFIFKDMAFTSLQRLSQVFNHDIFIVFQRIHQMVYLLLCTLKVNNRHPVPSTD